MKARMRAFVPLAVVLLLAACARHIPAPQVPPSSPLARVQIGMGLHEVVSLMGAPTDQRTYRTPKVLIPYYFGGDMMETEFHYIGLGRIVFAAGPFAAPAVIRVEEDRSEPGFYRQQR